MRFDWENALKLDLWEQGERVWYAFEEIACAGWGPEMDLHYALYCRGLTFEQIGRIGSAEELRKVLSREVAAGP